MREPLWDALLRLSEVLHWLGKHAEANACTWLGRFLRMKDLDDEEKLAAFVEAEEKVWRLTRCPACADPLPCAEHPHASAGEESDRG